MAILADVRLVREEVGSEGLGGGVLFTCCFDPARGLVVCVIALVQNAFGFVVVGIRVVAERELLLGGLGSVGIKQMEVGVASVTHLVLWWKPYRLTQIRRVQGMSQVPLEHVRVRRHHQALVLSDNGSTVRMHEELLTEVLHRVPLEVILAISTANARLGERLGLVARLSNLTDVVELPRNKYLLLL